MSRIYFHSPSGETEIRGTERYWLAWVVNELSVSLLDYETVKPFIREGHYLKKQPHVSLYEFRIAMQPFARDHYALTIDGEQISSFLLLLNTALAIGNDQIRLAARIHGQCEIHCYVEGWNRAWLAKIIEGGRDSGVYRDGMGWEDLIELLLSRDDEPVVMSYSVTESFPRPMTSEQDDSWYELPVGDQWEQAMRELRVLNDGREIKPEGFAEFRFDGWTVFMVREAAMERAKREGRWTSPTD